MKKVFQTEFGNIKGNCMQACMASLFELELNDVPNFIESGDDWEDTVLKFLKTRDLSIVRLHYDENISYEGYYIYEVMSSRDIMHWVIGRNGKVVHDPHPDGGIKEFKYIVLFVDLLNKV